MVQRLQPLGGPAVEEGEVKQPHLQEEGEPEDFRGSGEEEDEVEALRTEGLGGNYAHPP